MFGFAVLATVFISTQKSKLLTVLDPELNSECRYGTMPVEVYLDIYKVKQGDTLLSIANNQLGSTSRVNEIVNLNKNRPEYNSLYTSETIKEGWELYLSSKYLPPNSGDLVAGMGMLSTTKLGTFKGRMSAITHPEYFPSGSPVEFNNGSVFFGAQKFKEGDCVVIIRDEGTDVDILMGLQNGFDAQNRPEITFGLKDVELPGETSECIYNFLGPEEVMRRYSVKTGDSLASIAKEQLGDYRRAVEIVEANKDRYSSLRRSHFIEVGWELLLPPKWAVPTSGHITGFAGTFISENEEEYWLSQSLTFPAQHRFSKASSVKSFGKEHFEKGDCVVVLNNRGTAIGVSPQDIDYINLFKYGDRP